MMALVEDLVVCLQNESFNLLAGNDNARLAILAHDTLNSFRLTFDLFDMAGKVCGRDGLPEELLPDPF